ncbi:aromatic acid exporter family protein [Oryzobacter terrae]|uniref:FUSC family protein n=1 Tax=Oryzobacter terrae TaxID=1620385 RepID=UPI003670B7EE
MRPPTTTDQSRAGLLERLDERVSIARDRLRLRLEGPGTEPGGGLLMLKAAVATVIAWQLAVHVLDSDTPFYAPMSALLVVDRTMVRSVGASTKRVIGVVLGMGVAWLVGSQVGVTWWSMVPVMLVATFIGRWKALGEHGIQVPTMVLLSLLTVHGTDTEFTALTIVETALGGVVGVAVNALVLAPMHLTWPRRELSSLTERLRALLADMADGLRTGYEAERAHGWYDEAGLIGRRAPEVLEVVETGRESTRWNLRHRLRPARIDWDGYRLTAETVERAEWQVAGIARTLVDAAEGAAWTPRPSAGWLARYADVLDEVGAAIEDFGVGTGDDTRDVDEHVERALAMLRGLSDEVRDTHLDDPAAWPAYGALVLDAERLAHDLRDRHPRAAVPTDSGPLRAPIADALPPAVRPEAPPSP